MHLCVCVCVLLFLMHQGCSCLHDLMVSYSHTLLHTQERRKRLSQQASTAADASSSQAPVQAGEHAKLFLEDENGAPVEDAHSRRVRQKVRLSYCKCCLIHSCALLACCWVCNQVRMGHPWRTHTAGGCGRRCVESV